MKFDPKLLHYGIFGTGLSGKTTLAMHLSKSYWRKAQIKSLVLDPNKENWGPQAFVTDDEAIFWEMVWKRERDCALFVDEGGETIKRDSEKTPLFTRVRHRGHRLHIIGHGGMNLLPVQREQIHTVYLFRQSKDGADLWAEQFAEPRIVDSTTLGQYEFLHCRVFCEPKRQKLEL